MGHGHPRASAVHGIGEPPTPPNANISLLEALAKPEYPKSGSCAHLFMAPWGRSSFVCSINIVHGTRRVGSNLAGNWRVKRFFLLKN
jgi:hypothetical protein